jgi:putative membrane protein
MTDDMPRSSTRPPVTGDGRAPEAEPVAPPETEPDARFTFANERTFLAWHRTALALVVAGLAVVQLLPPFPGIPWGRHLLAVPLIVLGGALSVGSYLEWTRHQRALRRQEPLPPSILPRVLAISITVLSVGAVVMSVLDSGGRG